MKKKDKSINFLLNRETKPILNLYYSCNGKLSFDLAAKVISWFLALCLLITESRRLTELRLASCFLGKAAFEARRNWHMDPQNHCGDNHKGLSVHSST